MLKSISILTINLAAGGAEKVISLFLPELVKTYRVNLVLLNDEIHFPIPDSVNLVILHKNRDDLFSNKIFNFPQSISKYLDFIRDNQIDVSISFLTRPNFINGFIKIKCPSVKVIMSERGYPSINYKSSRFRFWLYKFLIPKIYNNADLIFSNSININQDLRQNFKIITPLKVIYNPVELKEISDVSMSGIFKLITVGSLRPIKNQLMTLESIVEFPYVRLTILGDGVLRTSLEQKAKELGVLQNVSFKGIVSDVNLYLKEHDCFILSSNSEGFPNVILEAMANGLPVISTNCLSGPLEILNENIHVKIEQGDFAEAKYGILVNVGDVRGLRKSILYLQNNPDILTKYSKLGYSRAKDYNVKSIYSRFQNMIEGV